MVLRKSIAWMLIMTQILSGPANILYAEEPAEIADTSISSQELPSDIGLEQPVDDVAESTDSAEEISTDVPTETDNTPSE